MADNLKNQTIMGIPFFSGTVNGVLEKVIKTCHGRGEKCFIVTANPEIVMAAEKDKLFKDLILSADIVVPDGIGIMIAAKWRKKPLQERIPGIELMEGMLTYANEKGLSCYFFGAAEEVNQMAVENIQTHFPELTIAGQHHGYVDEERMGEIAIQVQQTTPDFVFVALGYPKQEKWIAEHLQQFSKGIFIGVGGSLDVYAGKVNRAPDIWIKLHLEWFYRLLKQPTRIKRMGRIFIFMYKALFGKNV